VRQVLPQRRGAPVARFGDVASFLLVDTTEEIEIAAVHSRNAPDA
jgi:hypothetical protein